MSYAILRTAKLKSKIAVSSSLKHNLRISKALNANEKVRNAVIFEGDIDIYNAKLGDHNPRKNAVFGIEIIQTASPQWWENATEEQKKKFIEKSTRWTVKNFGYGNIVSSVVHFDEQTPHIHTIIIPMKEGKLNAKHYIGGTRDRLSKMQDTYHAEVKDLGLVRGEEKSKAKHTDIRKYYGLMKKSLEQMREKGEPFFKKGMFKAKPDMETIGNYFLEAEKNRRALHKHNQKLQREKQVLEISNREKEGKIAELNRGIENKKIELIKQQSRERKIYGVLGNLGITQDDVNQEIKRIKENQKNRDLDRTR